MRFTSQSSHRTTARNQLVEKWGRGGGGGGEANYDLNGSNSFFTHPEPFGNYSLVASFLFLSGPLLYHSMCENWSFIFIGETAWKPLKSDVVVEKLLESSVSVID